MNKFCLSELGRSLNAGRGSKKGPGPLLRVKFGDSFSLPGPNLGGTVAEEALFLLLLGTGGALAPSVGAVTPRGLGPTAGATAAAAGVGVGATTPTPPVAGAPADPGSFCSGLLACLLRIDRRFEILLIIPWRLPCPTASIFSLS